MLGMSLPMRVAVFVLLTMLICIFTAVAVKAGRAGAVRLLSAHVPATVVVLILLVVVPASAWKLVTLWLHDVPVRFSEIEHAWKLGLRSLAEHGMSITSAPLYLILGPRNAGEARALVESSELPLQISGVPDGNPPLVWFVGPGAIFLACPGASQVSLLSRSALTETGGDDPAPTEQKGIFQETMDGARGFPSESENFGDFAGSHAGHNANAPGAAIYNVSNPGFDMGNSFGPGAFLEKSQPRSRSRTVRPQVDRAQMHDASERLSYVCELLRRHRSPYCPLNGIMSFLPQRFITLSEECAAELDQAAAADARVLQQKIGLRAALAVLVGGMEEESGFRELVRRFGREIALRNRIGKGNPDLWSDTTPELLESLGRHAAGAFEDNIYPLFRKDSNLTEIGNTKLYKLLCLSRLRINDRLTALLRNAYATEDKDSLNYTLPFLGCYFAATGDREDRRAFAASVFDRLIKQVNELDWHPEVRAADERFFLFRDLLLGLNAMLLIAIGILIWRLTT